jgi:hypothetical protein
MASESEEWTVDDQDTAPITPEGFFVDQEDISQIRHFKNNLSGNHDDDDDDTPAFGLDGEDYDIEGDDDDAMNDVEVVAVVDDHDHEAMIRVLNEEDEEDNERLILLPTAAAAAMTTTNTTTTGGGIKSILSQGRFSYNSLPGISEEREQTTTIVIGGGMRGSKTSLHSNSSSGSRTSLNELEKIKEGKSSSSSGGGGGGMRRMGGSSRTSLNDIISNNSDDEETWTMRGGEGGGYDNQTQQYSPMRIIGGENDHNQDEGDGEFGRHRPQTTSSSPERAMPPRLSTSGDYYFTSSSHSPPATAADDIIPPIYAYTPNVLSGKILTYLSRQFVSRDRQQTHGGSALAGFLALLLVTCANCMLGPMRDAAALAVGVSHIPALTLASTVLALGSSVPVGWLFEAPDPRRRRVWKRMGLTRGETQGTSLALFYRVFAFLLLSYALGFVLVDIYGSSGGNVNIDDSGQAQKVMEESAIASIVAFFLRTFIGMGVSVSRIKHTLEQLPGLERRMNAFVILETCSSESIPSLFLRAYANVLKKFGKVIYIMFFLVVHLMKLHSLSLIWGVTTEAMEYEENAEQRRDAVAKEREGMRMNLISTTTRQSPPRSPPMTTTKPSKSSLRLKRLGFVGFGGTLGGILGSVIASFAAHILNLSGLLILAAILLELSANLSVELGRIMQRHWEEQMKHASTGDLSSLSLSQDLAEQASIVDSSLKKSASMGTMKRVASGSLSSGNLLQLAAQQEQMQKDRAKMAGDGGDVGMTHARSTGSISISATEVMGQNLSNTMTVESQQPLVDDNSFKQRLLRGVTTIVRSRLLMSIFTYNALSASASVLLSFQRAALVANRSSIVSSAVTNTAYLAKINTASSVAVFALQASGLGAYIASSCGQRGTLALMPVIRLFSVVLLGWWHLMSDGRPPNLIMFLMIDEFAKVINFAIAKPVRENLWRGLSAEARYEAKPIVDTLANRWGGGSAAFLVSFINGVTDLTGLLVVNEKTGEQSIFGFPPVLLLCMIISAWWLVLATYEDE